MKKLKWFFAVLFLICSLCLGFSACKKSDLPTPTEISVDIENQLSWAEVVGAQGYIVRIKNVESAESNETFCSAANYSLNELPEGNYEICVKALKNAADGQGSEWSEILLFEKQHETGCVYRLINGGTQFELTRVGSATGDVVLEGTYRGKPVTKIADAAFRSSSVKSVVIGENTVSVGASAFYRCAMLESVTLPESLKEIGNGAFQGCVALKEITLPSKLESVSDNTFSYCGKLERVDLGGVKSIGKAAFISCTSLAELQFPDSVVSIGEDAFTLDGKLTSVRFGKGVETIGKNAFNKCTALKELAFDPNGALTAVGESAFQECTSLAEVSIPDSVKDIGSQCFYLDEKLEKVTLPENLNHVGAFAFHATKLYVDAIENGEDFIFADDWLVAVRETLYSTLATLGDIAGNAVYTLYELNEDGTVNEDVETKKDFPKAEYAGIADNVFIRSNLTAAFLPGTVKYIGNYAFSSCEKLWHVVMSPLALGENCFRSCTGLLSAEFGNRLQTIGSGAFYNCSGLDVTQNPEALVPESVVKIGTSAFYGTAIWKKPAADGVIYAGSWAVGYSGKPTAISLREGTVGISDYAFYNCDTLQSVYGLSSSDMTYIGRAAFYGCSALTAATIGSNVSKIEDYTFYKCSELYQVSLPRDLKEIGRSAFYKCQKLSGVNLDRTSVEKIGDYAFYADVNLAELTFDERLQTVGNYAFYKCQSIQSVNLPASVREIGDRAFGKCVSLTNLSLGGTEKIGEHAFTADEKLESIVLPDSVRTVGAYAFYKCSAVGELHLNEGLEHVGDYSFFGLEQVKTLTLPASLKSIGKFAFKGLALQSLVLSKEVENISAHAVYGCSALTVYTDAESDPEGWEYRWNSSNRPVVYGCEFAEAGYVQSVTMTETTLLNKKASNGFSAPERAGYEFIGWAITPSGEAVYSTEQITEIPTGTTIYSLWEEKVVVSD